MAPDANTELLSFSGVFRSATMVNSFDFSTIAGSPGMRFAKIVRVTWSATLNAVLVKFRTCAARQKTLNH